LGIVGLTAAPSRLGRVGHGFLAAAAVSRRSTVTLSGIAVLVGRSGRILLLPGLVPVPLLGVPGLGFPSAGTFISRLSRRALIRRRLLRLERSIVFLCQKAVRLANRSRSDGAIGQPDAFGNEVVVYLRIGGDIRRYAVKVLHPGRMVPKQMSYLMVEHAGELLYRPAGDNRRIVVEPPPHIYRQGAQAGLLHRLERPSSGRQIRMCFYQAEPGRLDFGGKSHSAITSIAFRLSMTD
jgi:hypothetical protein